MKRKNPLKYRLASIASAAGVSALVHPSSLLADTLFWDGSDTANASADGGSGIWNASSANWWNGSANIVWSNGDDAVFGGAAGTVEVDAPGLSSNSLFFGVSGYRLDTHGFNLTTASLAGSNGFTKAGAGNLTITGDSAGYTGATTITGGMIRLTGAEASIANGGGISLNGDGSVLTGEVDGFNYGAYPFLNITRGGTLYLQATGDRIGSQTVTMNNGTLFWHASGNGTSATVQNVNLASGNNSIAVAPVGGNNTLHVTNLNRSGSTATVEFRSAYSPMGDGEPRVAIANVNGSAIANTNGILGGWAVVSAPSGGSQYSGGAQGFASWNGSNSIVLAGFDAQTSDTALSTATGTQNWLINGNGGATNWTITSDVTINSAVVQSDLYINDGSTLTVASGGLVFRNSNFWVQSSGGGFLTSGEATGKLFVNASGGSDQAIRVIVKDNGDTPVTFVKSGTGIVRLNQTNTYTGGTVINQGTLELTGGGGSNGTIRGTATVLAGASLRLSTNDATGYGANALKVINLEGGNLHVNTVSNQTLGSAVVNMTGGSITGIANSNLDFFGGASALNTLASSATATISGVALDLRQPQGVTFTVAKGSTGSGVDLEISSLITNRQPTVAEGPGTGTSYGDNPLIKAGEGTLRLTGDNNYTGETRVNAGTLLVDNTTGSGTGFGAVTVAAGATLGGSGIVGGSTTIAGIHSPGSSPGLQTFSGGLAYAAASTLVWELFDNTDAGRGVDFDGVDVTGGSFSIADGATIDLSFGDSVDFLNSFWGSDREWLVVSLSGDAAAADSNGFNLGAIAGGENYSPALGEFSVARDGGSVYLNWTAIPEPSTALLGGLGLLVMLRRRRNG